MKQTIVFFVLLAGVNIGFAQESDAKLNWSELPSMPEPVSGHFAGESNGSLLIVGGSNFPDKSPFQGGKKAWYDRIAVLRPGAKTWKTGYRFPRVAAYGVSAMHRGRLICAGGGNAERHSAEVHAVEVTPTGIRIERLPDLPAKCSFTAGAILGDAIYVVGGQAAPDSVVAMKTFWKLDLLNRNSTWEPLPPWPGKPRILPVVTASSDSLFVFSGADLQPDKDGKAAREYLSDAFRYSPDTGWEQLPNLPSPVVAGTAIVDAQRVLVFCGDDGVNASKTAELGDKHPGFEKRVLALDLKTSSWSTAGTMPFGLVTTNAFRFQKNRQPFAVIPGGEDRPGHRLSNVLSLELNGAK